LELKNCQLEGEDDKAMGIALNAIFGWENDLEAEEENLTEDFIQHMHMHKLQHNGVTPDILTPQITRKQLR
jgi:hypothetical protein